MPDKAISQSAYMCQHFSSYYIRASFSQGRYGSTMEYGTCSQEACLDGILALLSRCYYWLSSAGISPGISSAGI